MYQAVDTFDFYFSQQPRQKVIYPHLADAGGRGSEKFETCPDHNSESIVKVGFALSSADSELDHFPPLYLCFLHRPGPSGNHEASIPSDADNGPDLRATGF